MKDKIKNASRKELVEESQRQIRKAIDDILARDEKLSPSTKNYIEALEGNINIAPYLLGYLEAPEENKKKKS